MTNAVKSFSAFLALTAALAFPVQAQQFTKDFGKSTIRVNEVTTLTFTVTNTGISTLNFGFTDTLPVALQGLALSSNSCGGTPVATSTTLSLTGGVLAVGPFPCTVVFTVKGIGFDPGATNSAAGTGDLAGSFANANIAVLVPDFSKTFGGVLLPGDTAPTIPRNGTTTLTFNLTDNTGTDLPNFGWTDTLPPGFTVVSSPGTACGGTVTAPVGGTSIVLTGGSLLNTQSCSLVVTVRASQSSPPGVPFLNTVTGTGDLDTLNRAAFINVKNPTFTKSFSPTTIALHQTSALTFTIFNGTGTNLTAIGFTDPLPAGLQVDGAPTVNTCALPVSGAPGSIIVTGGSVNDSDTCLLTVPVRAVGGVPSLKQNNANGTGDLLGLPAGANLTVNSPGFTKSAVPPSVQIGDSTTFTVTINNTTGIALTNLAFSDALPAGLTIGVINNGCGGVLTPGANSFTLSGVSLGIGASCQVAFGATGDTLGLKTNTAVGADGLLGLNASADVDVTPRPPTFTKTFGSPVIALNGTTTLTFNIGNNTGAALSNAGFSDALPAGLLYVSTGNNTCGGSLVAAVGPPSTITLTGGAIPFPGNCTIVVNVKGAAAGVQDNTATGSGDLINLNPTASVTVNAPVFTKIFETTPIVRNTTSVLKIVITNTTGVTLNNIGFSDTLPAGMTLGALVSNDCVPAPVLAPPTITLSGATLINGASCTIRVNVTGTTVGALVNTATGSGDLLSINPQATLTVTPPPMTFSKVFAPGSILQNATTVLTFTINNPTGSTKSNIGFTDPMPAGLTVSGTPVSNCGGSFSGLPSSINFSGGTLNDLGTCTITANVIGATPGIKMNLATGTGDLSPLTAAANVTVIGPPKFTKAFAPATIGLNAVSVLTFTVENTTGIALPVFGFTDDLAVLGLTSPAIVVGGCGGTVTVAANVITLAGGTLPIDGTCTISINVVGATPGVKVNTAIGSGSLQGINATATLVVTSGPITFSKQFGSPTVQLNTNVSLTFTIANNTGAQVNNLSFNDPLPPGMTVVSLDNNTCGGVPTVIPGTASIGLTGGVLANGGVCTLLVTVKSSTSGFKHNVAVGSGDLAGKTAEASITVIDSVFTKHFSQGGTTVGIVLRLTFVITNTTGAPLNAGFTDPLPAGMVLATPPFPEISGCGAPVLNAPSAGTVITMSGAVVAPNSTCTISVDVINNTPGTKHNVAAGEDDIDDETATDDLDVFEAPVDAYQVRYFSNLNIGDSFINITNSGAASTESFPQNGNLCVNAYTYSPDEQLVSCCSCTVTPNGLASLSVKQDLISNTLTPIIPTSVVVKLLATRQSGACNAATPIRGDLRPGLAAYGATLHAVPITAGTPAGTYGMTETPFSIGTLSEAELTRMTTLCGFVQANGSGYGICKACRIGGLGAAKK